MVAAVTSVLILWENTIVNVRTQSCSYHLITKVVMVILIAYNNSTADMILLGKELELLRAVYQGLASLANLLGFRNSNFHVIFMFFMAVADTLSR